MNKLIAVIVTALVFVVGCEFDSVVSTGSKGRVTELSEAKTRVDSLYVIDMYYKSESGLTKPPCTISPSPCACLESRIEKLNINLKSDCE